jgi:hypothetical protein
MGWPPVVPEEIRRDEFGEMDRRVGQSQHGLEIAQEAVKDRMGNEHHQPEQEDGVAVVMEDALFARARDRFQNTFRARCHHGDSGEILGRVLAGFDAPVDLTRLAALAEVGCALMDCPNGSSKSHQKSPLQCSQVYRIKFGGVP